MGVRVQKKPQENSQTLIKKFKAAVIKSGVLLEKRKRLFKERKKSENLKRESALRRLKKQEQYRKLQKQL